MKMDNLLDRMGFSWSMYEAILDALQESGYQFCFFDKDSGEDGIVLLRHDVDKSIPRALEMARFEAERGVKATYFFLVRGALYNIMEVQSIHAIQEIARQGHNIALHFDGTRFPDKTLSLDSAILSDLALLKRVVGVDTCSTVSFHQPSKEVLMREPLTDKYQSAYDPKFMMPTTKYLSDSNAFWREGNPIPFIRKQGHARLQILVHPLWWTFDDRHNVIDILKIALKERHGEIENYLRFNHLWAAHMKRKEK